MDANVVESQWMDGFVTILAPTAAGASISGRVMTSSGRAISGAVVTVLDVNGVSRTFTTGTYGYYSFDGLAAGQTYMVTVASRRYHFADPNRVVDLSDSVTGLDFVGSP